MTKIKNYEISAYQKNPFGLLLILSRYKFVGRLVKKNDDILDLGCGRGIGTSFLAIFCRTVIGIDNQKENIEEAVRTNQSENVTYLFEDARNFSFDRSFNVVVLLDVIEHMSQNDAGKVLKTVKNVLSDDGFAVIGTPNIKSREYASTERKLSHEHEYSFEDFRELLEKKFKRVIVFSMTDETVNTGFHQLAWYFIAICF